MTDQETRPTASSGSSSAAEIFSKADKIQQEIVKAVLNEERKVIHQKHRTRIFDSIVGIIKERVQ